MPGRTPKSLQHQWQQIKAEAKAYRERAEDGPEAAAAASSDDDTPRRPTGMLLLGSLDTASPSSDTLHPVIY